MATPEQRESVHPSVNTMWEAYRATAAEPGELPELPPAAFHFCDNEADANSCADLVMAGRKRATAPSLWYFESRGEPLPRPGDLAVVTDWEGRARCVIRTSHVEVVPFNQVTAAHAAAEGEGDLSLEWWRAVHLAYYARELSDTMYVPAADMPIVLEYFERVFPAG